MIALFVALFLCLVTAYALRGGLMPKPGTRHEFDTTGAMLAVAAFAAAAYFFGPMYGVAITVSIAIHEYGHVCAYRVAGHDDARFRLIPLMGGVAISNRLPDTQAEDFFISLLGPGICIAPMVLAMVVAPMVWQYPMLYEFLMIFAGVTGALNFFNLLPFWPLDGGRCVKILAQTFWEPLGMVVAVAGSAAAAAAAIWMQSTILFFFALMGAQSLFFGGDWSKAQRKMTRWQGVQALAAYLFTAGAHLMGGLWLLMRFI